jgi:hypothetical protein
MAKLHQVFIGCAFARETRRRYDRLKRELEAETPLEVVLADTTVLTSTDDLLRHITGLIQDSAGCVFDATGGNPNVSLEVGIAHALPVDFCLTLYTRRPRRRAVVAPVPGAPAPEVKPMIADLQGRLRVEYRTYPVLKDTLVRRYLSRLPYMQRWSTFRRRHAAYVGAALQLFEDLRRSGRSVRPRIDAILDGSGIATTEFITALRTVNLIAVKMGRGGGYYYPKK